MKARKDYIAIFEYLTPKDDAFGTAEGETVFVAKEWISLTPQDINSQRGEFIDTAQTKGVRKSIAECEWSPTLATVDTACRMKIAKPNPVNESDPSDDANYRIFGIEQIVNVREQNRELQLMVTEKM